MLAASSISFVDSLPYKYMSCLWSLIWSKRAYMEADTYLIIWLEIIAQSSAMDF